MTDDDLTRLVLDKVGSTWDEIVETRATFDDIDEQQVNDKTLGVPLIVSGQSQ